MTCPYYKGHEFLCIRCEKRPERPNLCFTNTWNCNWHACKYCVGTYSDCPEYREVEKQ